MRDHGRFHGRFIELQSHLRRKELDIMNQGSNFLGDGFSNRGNVRAPIQYRRERQPQHFHRPIYFDINGTSVIRPVKRNQLNFSSIEINKPLLAPFPSPLCNKVGLLTLGEHPVRFTPGTFRF